MAIWTKTISAPSDLSVPAISENIGFQAQSVVVDNFTPYWLYIPSSLGYIPPWTTDVVRGLIHATDFVKVEWRSPFGDTQVIQSTAKFVSFLFTDAIIPSASGTLAYGTAQLIETTQPITYLLNKNVSCGLGLGNINAFYNLNTPLQLTSVEITNNTGSDVTVKVVRLNNDTINGGIPISSIISFDPGNPPFTNGAQMNIQDLTIYTGTKNETNTSTFSITLPTITTPRILVITFLAYGNYSVVTPPNGYTLIQQIYNNFTKTVTYYKNVDSSDSGATVSVTWNASIQYGIIMYAMISSAVGIIDKYSYSTYNSTTAIPFASVTPTYPVNFILQFIASNPAATFTPGAGTTELLDVSNGSISLWMGYYNYQSTSPTTPSNATASTSVSGSTQTISIPRSVLQMNIGDELYVFDPVPTATTKIFDISARGIIGRIGKGFGIITTTSDITKTIIVSTEVKVVS